MVVWLLVLAWEEETLALRGEVTDRYDGHDEKGGPWGY